VIAVRALDAVDWDRRTVGPYRGLHAAPGPLGLSAAYLLMSLAGIAAYPFLSGIGRMIDFLALSFATQAAAAFGLIRTPAGNRKAPWLLLAALTFFNVGNVAWYWYAFALGRGTGDGTIASLLAAIGQIFMFCAAITIVAQRGRNDIGGMIDSTIMSMAAGGLVWDFVLLPILQSNNSQQMARIATCVAVFMLTGILGCLTRLLLTAKEFLPALWLLVCAMGFSLSGVVLVALVVPPGTVGRPAYTDMIYLAGYTAVGLCALAVSVVPLLQPGPAPKDNLSNGRLAFLGFALCAMPVVGGAHRLFSEHVDGVLIAASAVLVTPLVMVRIWRVSAERARVEQAVRYEATHDPVTNLPNRHEFANRLNATLGSGRPLTVLFCDLDGFKAVNDRFGHAGGDQILIEVTERLRSCIREGDTLSRFGGDEFLILAAGAESHDASELCLRIDRVFRGPFYIDGEPVRIGASIGTVCDDGTGDGEELIHRADAAMYAAKQERREAPCVRAVAA
jgi:diguanylate cyclase (GGDEF)-like protein